jgi:hypothetical protein
VSTYKLLPGGSISLEALLDQLGILLQLSSASSPGASRPAHYGT